MQSTTNKASIREQAKLILYIDTDLVTDVSNINEHKMLRAKDSNNPSL